MISLSVHVQAYHCIVYIVLPLHTVIESLGSGNIQFFAWYNWIHVLICHKSVILLLSLEALLYHCSDMNQMVHSIVNIVITTISSTKVKPFLFVFIIF